MTQCGNIFDILSLCFCPIDLKGCCVRCPALCGAGSCLFFVGGYNCCCSLNVAAVSGAHALGGADPGLVRNVILPIISCIVKAMTQCISYGNGHVGAYRITAVALDVVSCRFRTGSRRCFLRGNLFLVTMPQFGIFFFKRIGIVYDTAAFTHCIVLGIFRTGSRIGLLIGKLCVAMIQSSYFVTHVTVTACAGVRSIAGVGTSRCCYNRGILMLMSLCRNRDRRGNVVNVDIDDLTAQLGIGIVCLGNTVLRNVYAAVENGYLHDKGLIIKLKSCVEVSSHYNGTSRAFHSGYAGHIVVGDVYVILCKETALLANHRFNRVCENLHTLEIGMQPVFHQVFEVGFI